MKTELKNGKNLRIKILTCSWNTKGIRKLSEWYSMFSLYWYCTTVTRIFTGLLLLRKSYFCNKNYLTLGFLHSTKTYENEYEMSHTLTNPMLWYLPFGKNTGIKLHDKFIKLFHTNSGKATYFLQLNFLKSEKKISDSFSVADYH